MAQTTLHILQFYGAALAIAVTATALWFALRAHFHAEANRLESAERTLTARTESDAR